MQPVVRAFAGLILAALLTSPDAGEQVFPRRPNAPVPLVAPLVPIGGAVSASDGPLGKTSQAAVGVKSRTEVLKVFSHPQLARASVHRIDARNPIDQRLVLLVRQRRDGSQFDWYQVLLPDRPNGSTGWVRSTDVRIVGLHQRLVVDLSSHSLVRWRGDRKVAHYSVAIGAPTTPTPTGTFYVWARVPQSDPNGPYGVYALGLSGFSILSDWPGGGRVAIHGTANPRDAGTNVSHGCVRVPNAHMRDLMGVPMGTPVTIRA
jgi:lipoprotein-anchoring transpeptidase ErfK/SrfK